MTDPALCKLKGFDKLFFEAGKAEGRRLERRALKRWGHVDLGGNVSRRVIVDQYLATKPAKRKERANGK